MNSKFFSLAEAFVAIVRQNSITDAASDLKASKSSVSQKLTELEAMLDVNLLDRTTRKMRLTPAGRKVFEQLVGPVDAMEDAVFKVGIAADLTGAVRGSVTLSAANSYLTHVITPKLVGFLVDFPEIKVHLIGSDRRVDFTTENVDLGIRIGPVQAGTYRSTSLQPLKRILCASPKLIESTGPIEQPDDLTGIPCILRDQEKAQWEMSCGGKNHSHRISGANLVVSTVELSLAVARNGLGVALLADVVVRKDIEEGRLVHILPEWRVADIPVILQARQPRMGRPAVRVLFHYLISELGK